MLRRAMGLLLLACVTLSAGSGCYVHVRDHGHRREAPVYREHRHHCDGHCSHGHGRAHGHR